MSNCNNCFNGCTETISDQCIRYTGIDVPVLGIHTGDPLSVIEQSLITFLVSTLDGSGIKIDLSGIDVCAVVQKYLPTCGEVSIEDISKALIEAACDIQEQVNSIFATLTVLNSDYVIGCLTGVTVSSDTHAIVQATITKLCSVSSSVTSILAQLSLFAKKSEICTLVEDCVNSNINTGLAIAKMIPYSIIPYYGAISNYPSTGDSFDGTGAGLGYWARVFMCNGQNGTPDLRGRVPVGATNTPSTNPFPTQTNPANPDNPTYGYKDSVTGIQGNNTTTLSLPQIPEHTHTTTVTINDPGHNHKYTLTTAAAGSDDTAEGTKPNLIPNSLTSTELTGLKGTGTGQNVFVTNATAGEGEAHSNVQPGLAVYYIMYIPA